MKGRILSNIHLILQGKGGVGKSFTATILAEYFISKDQKAHCIDCDAVNQTFAGFRKLDVHHLPILKDGVIDPRSFDALIEQISATKDDYPFIIDNGSSGFIAVCDYLLSNKIVGLLKEMGHQVFIHTLLTGGDSMADTLGGFIGISNHFSDVQLVVWHNAFYGSLFINGKPIDEETLFTDHCQNVFAQIHLPKPASATFGQDLIDLRRKKLTLAEGIEHTKFSFMTRHRLKVLRDSYFAALEQARL